MHSLADVFSFVCSCAQVAWPSLIYPRFNLGSRCISIRNVQLDMFCAKMSWPTLGQPRFNLWSRMGFGPDFFSNVLPKRELKQVPLEVPQTWWGADVTRVFRLEGQTIFVRIQNFEATGVYAGVWLLSKTKQDQGSLFPFVWSMNEVEAVDSRSRTLQQQTVPARQHL